jgi:hypothetical protein
MVRSTAAVISGVFTILVLVVIADAATARMVPGAFDAKGFSTSVPVLLAVLAYTIAFSTAGGWMTAFISCRQSLRDVYILAALQFAATLAANVMMYDRRFLWFYALGLLSTPVAIIAGGRLRNSPSTSEANASS